MQQTLKATNNFVFLQRDSIGKEKGGLLLPASGQIKPHKGLIVSIGGLVKDPNIKAAKNKSCLYHPTVGFSIEYEGVEYWVLSDNEIIAIV